MLRNAFDALATETTLEEINVKTPALVSGAVPVSGPLTDTQLRASGVPVTFAAPVEISNDAGNPIPVSGPLTDAQLRAASVPISGAVTGDFYPATQPVSATALPLPAGASTEATLAALSAKFGTSTTIPDNQAPAISVRPIGQDTWVSSFSGVGASFIDPQLSAPVIGAGVTFNQAAGSLNIVTGVTANAEFLTRSLTAWRGTMQMRYSFIASQRIANQNCAVLLADLIGEGLSCTINSATSVTVTKTAHGFTAQNVGQFMFVGGIVGANGVPGRYAIASTTADTITLTVAGWPASGSCTLSLFGHSHVKHLYNGVTATNLLADGQRRGWASGDSTLTINTTASPGHIMQAHLTAREVFWQDTLRASATAPNVTSRGSRFENIPDDNLDLYVFLWSYNGTVAPATTTTWTIGFVAVEKFANLPVYVQGQDMQGTSAPAPVQVVGAANVAGTVSAVAAASTSRSGFTAAHGVWYDDTSTVLALNATFTGTARDLTVTATAVAFANAATFAKEFRASVESDVSGTLWLEASRDNITWRRVKSVATAAVTGGGQYAEIIHLPSWRYIRSGFTNGAVAQARMTLGSMAMGA